MGNQKQSPCIKDKTWSSLSKVQDKNGKYIRPRESDDMTEYSYDRHNEKNKTKRKAAKKMKEQR